MGQTTSHKTATTPAPECRDTKEGEVLVGTTQTEAAAQEQQEQQQRALEQQQKLAQEQQQRVLEQQQKLAQEQQRQKQKQELSKAFWPNGSGRESFQENIAKQQKAARNADKRGAGGTSYVETRVTQKHQHVLVRG